MGYTIEEGRVRVDFFKPSGKWSYTGSVDMGPFYHEPITHEALKKALDESIEGLRLSWRHWLMDDGVIVCLEPFHQHAHPIMLTSGSIR